ncbi:hypothetical protein J4E93_003887 [Alternaria ventricosa]|uniref:uncharacterized protein n=1 Tax=Alternaria ventricosa TaxID=1187951 RepID=UPI0020C42263|nr:uncharacterized protein J4E93_003887 [Alternaria ventricosa]KAI4649567.1 hypothetical protein J4E93_003887 [Alternaria ventricosa]
MERKRVDGFEDEPRGLRIIPSNNNNNDTVANAIARSLTDTRKGHCDTCNNEDSDFTGTHSIIAAPEYLRIYLSLALITKRSVTNGKGETVVAATLTKNRNHIIIPDILDLTQHMDYFATMQNPDPVRYKLVSATYHKGDQLNAGHYTAAVTGHMLPGQRVRPQFFCDDANIIDLPPTAAHPNTITENPIRGYFDAVTLYYERIAPTGGTLTPANKLSKADLKVVEEGKGRSDPPPRSCKGKKEGNEDEKKGNRSRKRKNNETKDDEVQEEKTQKGRGKGKGKGKASENEQELNERVKMSEPMDQSSWDALQQAYDLSKAPGPLDQNIWTAFGQLCSL